ncbi:MAG: peptide ABC transporter substrate-binding protein [Clostridia bacterium]|nr:peptide ABC transporter substrate-binding protein [Clostridia bacterium]
MKKVLAILLAVILVTVSFAACGKGGGASGGKTGTKTGVQADEINVCLASEPDTIDPALNSAVDGATLIAHLFSGLAKWHQTDDGSLELVADAATELTEGVVNPDGTVTYTYTLRDGLTWSDGQPLTAGDFIFAWNRAASPELAADYGYMFEVVDGYEDMQENGAESMNISAPDDKTITVTLITDVPYWNELLAFPAYFPVREDVVADEKWATEPDTYVSNGPYTLTAWTHNSVITLEKNENYYDADSILMPKINFYLSDDANNMLANFKNGDWQLIDDIPTNEIQTLKADYPDEFKVTGQIGTYYVCWNINEEILPSDSGLTGVEAEAAREEIRSAIGLLFDRNYIVDEVAQGGQVPASSFVAMGLTDADNSEFYKNAGHNADFDGYYDVSADALQSNYDSAIETLKKYYKYDDASQKFTNFPAVTYLYNTSEGHKAIAEYLQSALAAIGITMNLENQEWNTFLNTRKDGNFTVARNGWLADYNDPISFLDMWTSGSGNNDVQFGKGDNASLKHYNLDLTEYGFADVNVKDGTWAETYDVLISKIKTCTDQVLRYKLMHLAEDMLMQTGCLCPLYFYTDLYMIDDSVDGFFSNPLGFKYFMYTTVID